MALLTPPPPPPVGGLAFASYLDAIGEEADRLVVAAERGLEAPVATCPGWTVGDLVAHVAGVYRFFTAQLEAEQPDASVAPAQPDASVAGAVGETIDRFERDTSELVAALVRSGPAAPCWNWSGVDLVSGWVARRMALETAVHRVDGEIASGRPAPIETELAVDGIDERIAVHLAADVSGAPEATLGGSLCLVCDDDPASFLVEVGGGRLRWRRGRGPADAAIVASASALFLFTWNRVTLADLALTGSRDVALAWRTLPG